MAEILHAQFHVYHLLLLASLTSPEAPPTWVPVCYPQQRYEVVNPVDIVCGSPFATDEMPVTVKEFSFKSLPHQLGACICKAFERRQFCESNILWATTSWENVSPIAPLAKECAVTCRDAFTRNANVEVPFLPPLHCPWWARASNTSTFYTASLHTALFHPLQNKLDLLKESVISCRLSGKLCWVNDLEVVYPREDLFRTDCSVEEAEVRGWLRLDGTDSATLRLVGTEEVLSFSHLCTTKICGKEGVLSDEGVLVSPATFPNPIRECNSALQSPNENKMLAHTEFIGSVVKREVNRLSRDVCTLASNIVAALLRLGAEVQGSLIRLLDEGLAVKEAYIIHSGKLFRKPCIRVKLHRYSHLCPGVWEANTTKGRFYAHGILPELRVDKPACLAKDNVTTLPGGYVVVKKGGQLVAVPGSKRHHDVIHDLTHHDMTLINEQLADEHLDHRVPARDRHQKFGYTSLLPDFKTWLKIHPLLTGLVSTVLVLTLSALAFKLLVRRCRKPRQRRQIPRPARAQESIMLMPRNHPGSPQSGPIL